MNKLFLVFTFFLIISCENAMDSKEEKQTLTRDEAIQKIVDKGILVKLPPQSGQGEVGKVKERNVLRVLVDAKKNVFIREEKVKIKDIKEIAKEFIANPEQKENLAKSPRNAIISLKNERDADYDLYLKVYNELKTAYLELWEASAQKHFQKSMEELSYEEQRIVKSEIPLVLTESEPDNFD